MTIAGLQSHFNTTGETPTWYQFPPARVACCAQVAMDPNTLRETGEEWSFSVGETLDDILPDQFGFWSDFADDLDQTIGEFGSVQGEFDGFRYINVPQSVSGTLGGQPFVTARSSFDLSADAARLDVGGSGTIDGSLYVDGTGAVRTAGIDGVFVEGRAGFKELSKSWEKEMEKKVHIPFWGKVGFEAEAELGVLFGLEANGMLGGTLRPSTITPETTAGGIGATAAGNGTAGVEVELGAAEASALADLTATLAAKVESFSPTPQMLADGTVVSRAITSPYTDITYQGIETPVVVLIVGPFDLSVASTQMQLDLGPWRPVGFDLDGFDVHWSGAAAAFGKARITSADLEMSRFAGATGFSALSMATTTSTATNDLSMQPDDRVLVFEVHGAPGETGTVRIERPMLHYLPNGTLGVGTWSLDLPTVTVGAEGKALLAVDAGDLEQEVLERTAAGESFENATAAANLGVDSNGDGVADLVAGSVPFDGRRPLRVSASASGEGLDQTLQVGDEVALRAHVEALDGTGVPLGTVVSFSIGGTSLGTAATDVDGDAVLVTKLPAMTVGERTFVASFGGDATLRQAEAEGTVDVVDVAPEPSIRSPLPLTTFKTAAPTASLDLDTPLDATLVRVRLDGGAWMAAAATPTGHAIDLTLSGDGVHQVEVEVKDAAGLVGTTATLLSFDSGAPDVTFGLDDLVLSAGDDLRVAWFASEDVGGMARLTEVATGLVTEHHSDSWSPLGGVVFEDVAAGLYELESIVVDAAGNEVSSKKLVPRLVLVV